MSEIGLFFREFVNNFHTTGAIMPSGRRLAQALARFVAEPGQGARRVLEVGPGTGAVTRHIIPALRSDDVFHLVELNDAFVAALKDNFKTDPLYMSVADRATIMHQSAEDVPGDGTYDVIVSGLPLNNFTPELVERLLSKMMRLLKPGGTLSFFEYIAVRRMRLTISVGAERRRIQGIDDAMKAALTKGEFRRDSILLNVPPAWVHHLRAV